MSSHGEETPSAGTTNFKYQKVENPPGLMWARAGVVLLLALVTYITVSFCMHVYYDRDSAFKAALSCTEEVLVAHGVQHWLQNGTLLGSTRLGRLVLWDADLDIGILADNTDTTTAALADLDEQCYGGSATVRYGALVTDLRIWRKCTSRVCAEFHETKIDNHMVHTGDGTSASSELMPLKNCTVAGVSSFCPINSAFYLSQAFGTDWLTTPLASLF